MSRYRVRPSGPLRGVIRVPGDKSIGHRALIFAALANGPSVVRNLSAGLDNHATSEAFRAMGVRIDREGDTARIAGVGLHGLTMPRAALDCGNSGTTMRLLAGLLAGQQFGARLAGDASLSRRPMRRIVEPLRARGAHIAGSSGAKENEVYPPLSIAPLVEGEHLIGLEYDMPVASAQVKSALLLSGLYARGPTALREPVLSRDHTERMMVSLGLPLETAGPMVALDGAAGPFSWPGFEWTVPGDLSSAAFLLAVGTLVSDSRVVIENVGVNPTRTGVLDALRMARATVSLEPHGQAAGDEPIATLTAMHCTPVPTKLGGELVTRMIDEVPIFCAIAATGRGTTEIRDAGELRVKESDRLAAIDETLSAFGVACHVFDDGIRIEGGTKLRGATVKSFGDHRIAMSAAILGLVAEGESVIDDVDCVETSFPGFAELLRNLGADIRTETR